MFEFETNEYPNCVDFELFIPAADVYDVSVELAYGEICYAVDSSAFDFAYANVIAAS